MWGQDEHILGTWLHNFHILLHISLSIKCLLYNRPFFLAKWKLQAPGFTQMALKDSAHPTLTSQHCPHSSPPDCTAKSPPSLNSYLIGWCLHCRKKAGFYTSLSEVCITSLSGDNKSSQARLNGLSSARNRSLITGDWKEQSAGTQTFCPLVFPVGEEGQDAGLLLFRRRTAARAQCPAHLLGDGGDEGGWSGRGDERESVSRRAGRVGRRAQGQPHCDAKRAPDKEGRKKRSIRNIEWKD